jgi:NAD(P)-dependent dehydrogenase (short-subunit alcohol dehydrogenase family)
MSRFQGKVAIVAGGARGLGGRIAEDFVEQGGRVAIGDVDGTLGAELAAKIGEERAVFVQADVTDSAQCMSIVDAAWSRFGSADCLVNSAISINGGELLDLPLEKWQRTVDIGLTGTFLMGQAFARRSIAAKQKGSIVNLSSVAAFNPYGGSGAYSTVKAAIIHLTELMAIEWAPYGIRANAVAPGTVETPLTAYLKDPEIRRLRSETIPLARVGQPEDVSPAVLYFLSDDAAWVTAATLAVDGGVNMSLMNHIPGRTWSK